MLIYASKICHIQKYETAQNNKACFIQFNIELPMNLRWKAYNSKFNMNGRVLAVTSTYHTPQKDMAELVALFGNLSLLGKEPVQALYARI